MKRLLADNTAYLNSEALKIINYDEGKQIQEATFSTNKLIIIKNTKTIMAFLQAVYNGEPAGTFIDIKPYHSFTELT